MKAKKIGYSINVTIPKNIVDFLKIKDGDELFCTSSDDNKLIISKDVNIIIQIKSEEAQKYINSFDTIDENGNITNGTEYHGEIV